MYLHGEALFTKVDELINQILWKHLRCHFQYKYHIRLDIPLCHNNFAVGVSGYALSSD